MEVFFGPDDFLYHKPEENTLYWLKKSEEWTSSLKTEPRVKKDVSLHVQDLSAFLGELNKWLKSIDDVPAALKQNPKLGHLLGRLCSCHHLIAHEPQVYSKLLSCVQVLRTNQPQDGVEKRAKEWAESQIRHTVSFYNQSNPGARAADSMGYTALEHNTLSTEILIQSIQLDLEQLIKDQHHFLIGVQSQSVSLEKMSALCTPVLSDPSSKSLVERLLLLQDLHPQSAEDGLSEVFLDHVTRTQARAYDPSHTDDWQLSHDCLVSLWLRYLPALEQEILLLLQACTSPAPHTESEDVLKVMQSRGLPRACAEHRVLYEAVDLCIQKVLWKTNGSQSVVRFIHTFQKAVDEAICSSNSSQVTVERLFPQRLLPLVNLLAVNPTDLPAEAHGIHVTSLEAILRKTLADPVVANNPREMCAVWIVLVKFVHWYHAAVFTALRTMDMGSSETKDACLMLVGWFHQPLSFKSDDKYKEQVGNIVEALQHCVMDRIFKRGDLQDALSHHLPSSPLRGTSITSSVCRELVMSALLQSSCLSDSNALELLDMVYPKDTQDSSQRKLALLQQYMDIYREVFLVAAVGSETAYQSHVTHAARALKGSLDDGHR